VQDEFRRHAQQDVDLSQASVHENAARSPISFSPSIPAHGHLQSSLLETEESAVRSSGAVLELVARAKSFAESGKIRQASFRDVAETVLDDMRLGSPKDGADDGASVP
jgi:hypothetical protein